MPGDEFDPLIGEDYEEFKKLEGHTLEELLRGAQKALLIRLIIAVNKNEASHQEEEILRKLLADNGMIFAQGFPQTGEAMAQEAEAAPGIFKDLPDFSEPEYSK